MTEQSPRKLGKYEIIEEIGRGANGIVYKAVDARLQRTVALKVLHPRVLWEPDLVARFYREASAAARLEHPNILDVHDVDEAEGVHYIAMKYLPGRTVEQIIDEEGPVPLREAVPIVRQIAAALDHAHKKGLLHRDIRPSNIMVDDQGHATLMDFGLSVGIDSAYASGPSGLTGTAEYIAPEVWRNQKPDERSDLYSLGVVVYEMLVGEPPFKADSAAAIMTKHLTEEPAFPPGLPERVRLVLAKALAKDREQRYQSARELAQALEDAVAAREEISESVESREPEPTPRRLAAGWIVAGVLVIALLIAVSIVVLQAGGLPAAVPPTQIPTATIQPTATWTTTPTMSPTNRAAPMTMPAATATSTPTATLSATATPTFTPIVRAMPSSTPKPPPTNTAMASSTSLPPGANSPYQPPKLVDPSVRTDEPLQWTWSGQLAPDEYFDVRVWLSTQPWEEQTAGHWTLTCAPLDGFAAHQGVAWTKETRFAYAPLTPEWVSKAYYCWCVAVIRGQNGVMSAQLSPESDLGVIRERR